jgi:hypothetical protein
VSLANELPMDLTQFLTLFLIRHPITEYGRVFVDRDTIKQYERDTLWIRTAAYTRIDVDGNPNHPQNGGVMGLAGVHCLGSMANHAAGSRKNAEYENFDFSSAQAVLDLSCSCDVHKLRCVIVSATRDIQKDEQILCNYDLTAALGMDIPFDNVSLGQFICICFKSVRSQFF